MKSSTQKHRTRHAYGLECLTQAMDGKNSTIKLSKAGRLRGLGCSNVEGIRRT
jgi:hypothetical protein